MQKGVRNQYGRKEELYECEDWRMSAYHEM